MFYLPPPVVSLIASVSAWTQSKPFWGTCVGKEKRRGVVKRGKGISNGTQPSPAFQQQNKGTNIPLPRGSLRHSSSTTECSTCSIDSAVSVLQSWGGLCPQFLVCECSPPGFSVMASRISCTYKSPHVTVFLPSGFPIFPPHQYKYLNVI